MCKYVLALILVLILSPFARAEIRTEPVEYRDGPVVLEGYLAYDDAKQNPRPGVLVVPEWWGLNDYARHRAEQLARMGYVAFAIDMYGKGKVTDNPQQAGEWATPFLKDRSLMRQRAKAGLDVLMQQKYVEQNRVAAIGYCFGGAVALELARAGMPLAGVISFHGNLSRSDNQGPDDIKAKILICHGADDPMVSRASLAAFEQEMKDVKANYQINIYCGAKHAFTNPDADKYNLPGIGYNKEADERSWMALCDFFEELFEPQIAVQK